MGQEGNRRKARRRGIAWSAVVKHGHRSWSCTIVDISKAGARLRLIGSVPPKSMVQLVCDRFGTLEGVVAWRKDELAGIEFRAPPSEVESRLGSLVPGLRDGEPGRPSAAARPVFGRLRRPSQDR